jgi:phosphatidylserine/phosphatidylglycerophosphate/cardiolipin synthase-like enzyme
MNDPDIAHLLQLKAETIPVTVAYDPKESNLLPEGKFVRTIPYKKQGLMHRKVIGIDRDLVLLGSTNLTPLSLKIHKNMIACIRSKELYLAIIENKKLEKESYSFYPLPESGELALHKLLETFESATKRIYICIFTFTHEDIANALIKAKKRGIDVRVYIDKGSSTGTSKKIVQLLHQNQVPTFPHLGAGLLHHKCALIDTTFLFGSTNFTKAAFTKNEEHLLFLPTLSPPQLAPILSFFRHLQSSTHQHPPT